MAENDKMEILKLVDVVELSWPLRKIYHAARIEIFESVQKSSVFKARVFVKNAFMLYPTFVNQDARMHGKELIYSDEQLFTDMSVTVFEDISWLTGIWSPNALEFRGVVVQRVVDFFDQLEASEN